LAHRLGRSLWITAGEDDACVVRRERVRGVQPDPGVRPGHDRDAVTQVGQLRRRPLPSFEIYGSSREIGVVTGRLRAIAAGAVRTRVWRNYAVEADDFPFEQVSDYLEQPDCVVWADLCDPDPALLGKLAEELSLDPHAVEDATSEHQRPKAT